jgi:two-component system, LytTR family, response regulator
MLNILIVDDEPLAHDVLLHHCSRHTDLNVVGQCYNAAQALSATESFKIDLMFVDIRMPRFGGLELLRGMTAPPLAIIVSAHKEYALDGFELDIVDYLLKPVSAERFSEALDRVRRRIGAQKPNVNEPDRQLVLRVDRTLRRFDYDDIDYIQAQGNFVLVSSCGRTFLATATLKGLLDCLPVDQFVRVHKSYIVRRSAILEQKSNMLRLKNGREIPIGKSFRGTSFFSGVTMQV